MAITSEEKIEQIQLNLERLEKIIDSIKDEKLQVRLQQELQQQYKQLYDLGLEIKQEKEDEFKLRKEEEQQIMEDESEQLENQVDKNQKKRVHSTNAISNLHKVNPKIKKTNQKILQEFENSKYHLNKESRELKVTRNKTLGEDTLRKGEGQLGYTEQFGKTLSTKAIEASNDPEQFTKPDLYSKINITPVPSPSGENKANENEYISYYQTSMKSN